MKGDAKREEKEQGRRGRNSANEKTRDIRKERKTRGQREEDFLVRVIFRRSAPFSRGREAMKRGAARISAR